MAKVAQITKITTGENVLKDYAPVIKIGIQAPKDTVFQLNEGSDIEMGKYGIYELDLEGLGYIDSLVFKGENKDDIIIVDIVYEGSGPQ